VKARRLRDTGQDVGQDAGQAAGRPSIALSLAQDVEIQDRRYFALSETPWLRIDFDGPPPAGRWIRFTYSASLLDPLIRPLLRCFIGSSYHDEILPGALLGRAVWQGLIPAGTQEIWISPTNRLGAFGFSIDSIAVLSTAELIWRCMRGNPIRCLRGLGARLIGLTYVADTEFRRVLSQTPLADYARWRKLRLRDLDLTGLDMPRTNWELGPNIRFVTVLASGDLAAVQPLIAQLGAQPYPNWSVAVIAPQPLHEARPSKADCSIARIMRLSPSAMAAELLEGLSDDDFIAPIATGDTSPAYAVAVLAEAAQQDPAADIFYADQEVIDQDGRHRALKLRPDWSPIFYAASPFLNGAEFLKVKMLKPFAGDMPALELLRLPQSVAQRLFAEQPVVRHIRRVMRTRCGAPTVRGDVQQGHDMKRAASSAEGAASPCATIIIPTKDRLDLIEHCLDSLRRKTVSQNVEVIVVDNGSIRDDSRRFFEELVRDSRFRVVARPGPFNFSKLCNEAAAEASASTLVFLNNDTEIIDAHWLEPLLYWAQRPDVGAAGAKLLYPDGRVQHAGVVLGIDGRAGHFERGLEPSDPGYFGRLCVAHEVSAVTAACLAVDKRKFDAVGGFDAVNLPVELNDIDLCLRLSEHGWTSVCTSQSVLIHREAASRGTTLRPDETYRDEHRYFRARWMHRLRDDPFFHPALSLARLDAGLG
jgi:O-antigen biosynthesis protein